MTPGLGLHPPAGTMNTPRGVAAPRVMRRFALVLLATVLTPLATLLVGCPPSTSDAKDAGASASASAVAGVDGGAAQPAAPNSAKSDRPPFPNMATAPWGQRVLEERVNALATPAATAATNKDVVDALHEMTPASAKRAAELAASAYRSGKTNAERGTSVALLGAALVLDPTVDGYKERVTDAHGLAAYAGTLDASDAIGQGARAVVMGAAGQVAQAKRLVEVVDTTPALSPDARLFLALARKLTGDVGDALIADLQSVIAARPTSGRARAALAELWLDLGLAREAADTATLQSRADAQVQPWLDAIRGRALVVDGNLDEGLTLLKAAEPKLDEGNRGDALYWLGRSLTSKEGTPVSEIEAIAATLSARPGFQKEGAVLQALVSLRSADFAKARSLVEPLVKGRPMLPVDGDAAWLLADACAGLGDLRCVDDAGRRARAIDGDEARYQQARAAAVLIGKADSGDGDTAALGPMREAHRASPFDAKLGAKVKEPVVDGGAFAASRVRAARKALARRAYKVVDVALAPVLAAKGGSGGAACRVCRALDAQAAAGVDAAQKGAKALQGAGPELAVADLIAVIDALGEAPIKEAMGALDALEKKDTRGDVLAAIQKARGDHKDPDARRRREDKGAGAPPGAPGAHAGHGHEGGTK